MGNIVAKKDPSDRYGQFYSREQSFERPKRWFVEDKTEREEEKTYQEYRRPQSNFQRRSKWGEEQKNIMDREEESFEKPQRWFMEDKTEREEEKTYPEYRRSHGRSIQRRPKWEEEQGTLMDRNEENFEKHQRWFMEDKGQRKEEETYPEYRRSKTSIQRRPDWRKEQRTLMNRKEKTTKPLLVGAIDFGTTYSGWACSFLYEFDSDPTKASVKQWYSGSGSLTTEKTPTCVLVQPDGKTLEAFGYEAENKYRELVDDEEHERYYYFKKFKMMLNKKLGEKLDRSITLEDEMGRSLLALDVFAMAIKYLKEDMLFAVKDRLTGVLRESEVHRVLTVPAIWTDGAKQFMREAANKAGITGKHLTISLEPEAASVYCRNLSVETTVDDSGVSVAKFKAGTQYMILDAGGGTIDITVHRVEESGGVKEVHAACGGGWGGTVVDKAFENMLLDLFTRRVYEKFKRKETEDWLDLWRDFEIKKRAVNPTKSSRINMKFPISLIDLYKKVNRRRFSDALSRSRYEEDISFSGDKMRFSAEIFQSLFETSVEKTIGYMKGVLRDTNVKAILMVGGFSESPILQHAVKSSFHGVTVVIPKKMRLLQF